MKNLKDRIMAEISRCGGGVSKIARRMGLERWMVDRWFNRDGEIKPHFAIRLEQLYQIDAYVLDLNDTLCPEDPAIEKNKAYLYVQNDILFYALLSEGQVIRNKIKKEALREHFFKIKKALENKDKKQHLLTQRQHDIVFEVMGEAGYCQKTRFSFDASDLCSDLLYVTKAERIASLSRMEQRQLRISARAKNAWAYARFLGNRQGRPLKTAGRVSYGRTLDRAAEKFDFSNRKMLMKVLQVIQCGYLELVDAMDEAIMSISLAEKISRLPKKQQRIELEHFKNKKASLKKNDVMVMLLFLLNILSSNIRNFYENRSFINGLAPSMA